MQPQDLLQTKGHCRGPPCQLPARGPVIEREQGTPAHPHTSTPTPTGLAVHSGALWELRSQADVCSQRPPAPAALSPVTLLCVQGQPWRSSVLLHSALGEWVDEAQAGPGCSLQGGALPAQERQQVHSSGDGRAGSGCPAWASVTASVGTGGVVGGMMVGGWWARWWWWRFAWGHVRHMASMTEMVQMSQVAPARDPRLGPPDPLGAGGFFPCQVPPVWSTSRRPAAATAVERPPQCLAIKPTRVALQEVQHLGS